MGSPVLVVYGHVGFDVDTRSAKVTRQVGGAAYYAARAAQATGCQVTIVSAFGEDFPLQQLDGMDHSASRQCSGPSAVFHQTYTEDNNVIAFDCNLNACELLSPEQIPLNDNSPAVIFIATAPPLQQSRAIAWLKDNRYRGQIAVDTNLSYIADFETMLENAAGFIHWVFLNAEEYEALRRPPPLETGLIVKRGTGGASMRVDGRWLQVATRAVPNVITTTGAGDVLAGSFLAALLRGDQQADALSFAVFRATNYVELGLDV